MKKYENNPYTLSFGKQPEEYIVRAREKDELIEKLTATPPVSNYYIITGIRGSGKTVLLTSVSNELEKDDNNVVIELNPEDDLRESLAAKLYSKCKIKKYFLDTNFNFSFKGVGFSISGKNPVLNIDDLLDKMFDVLTKQKKRVYVLIDEVTNNSYLKQFALSSQILIRQNYNLFVIMTSLYENISSIENEKNLIFLIRSPRMSLASLNLSSVASSYQEILGVDYEKAIQFAHLTKGYAFGFQLLGYLLFTKEKKEINKTLLAEYDQYLEEFVYQKVWSGLTVVEQNILRAFNSNESVRVAKIMSTLNMDKSYFSKYRDRLLKKGIVTSLSKGTLSFTLPRFREFIDSRI